MNSYTQIDTRQFRRYELIVLLVAAVIFIGCIVSPPALMDDVDSVQASIAHTMLQSGDWVTPHLDGVKYFEKPPLKYWLIAIGFQLFGVHDYVARLPLALIDVFLCWLVFRMGAWAFGNRAGLYAGLAISTCIGLFLFTRILIADSQLTFAILLALWSVQRSLDSEEKHPRRWGLLFWASIAVSILFKGFIGALFPCAAAFVYLLFTGQLLSRESWRRLSPAWGLLLFLLIAAPWHVLATLRNPPYLLFSLQSGPGNYRGFFWFYFFNEHILRFLNRRYPRDYNTVPLLYFWLFNLLWLFPWSAYLPTLLRLPYKGVDRAARTRLLALCLTGIVMIFFSFSSTQEYYSMPIYPAMALLLGSGLASAGVPSERLQRIGNGILVGFFSAALLAIFAIVLHVWNLPTPGDISQALNARPENTAAYTLSLGHMGDLTLNSFAYLRTPLVVAAAALLIGIAGLLLLKESSRIVAIAITMAIFFHAARLALVAFSPYLSSQPLAAALLKSPPGQLVVTDQYYAFSSVLFYANRTAYLLNSRINNLEYGSNAPGAPQVFIDDADLARLWHQPQRCYLLVEHEYRADVERIVGPASVTEVKASGGKFLLTNLPSAQSKQNPGTL